MTCLVTANFFWQSVLTRDSITKTYNQAKHHCRVKVQKPEFWRNTQLLITGPYDGSSKVLFPLLALNRNSMRDASCFKLKLLHHNNATKTRGLICLKKESV